MNMDSYRQNAADCVRQAQDQETPEDKNLLLNVALAWLRLAQQTRTPEPGDAAPLDPSDAEPLFRRPAQPELAS